MESAGQQATTIFAANGAARHRLVRAAIVAGFALLAAWAVALALGVMGGFGSLPMLPSAQSHGSSDPSPTRAHVAAAGPRASARATAFRAQRIAAAVETNGRATSGGHSVAVRPHATPQATRPQKVTPSPNSGSSHVSASSGHGYGTTRTTLGKPTGTPGNASGGSGAPGRLR
jgi:hypothetical protein